MRRSIFVSLPHELRSESRFGRHVGSTFFFQAYRQEAELLAGFDSRTGHDKAAGAGPFVSLRHLLQTARNVLPGAGRADAEDKGIVGVAKQSRYFAVARLG